MMRTVTRRHRMKKSVERRTHNQAVQLDRRRSDDDIANHVFCGYRPARPIRSMTDVRPPVRSRTIKPHE